MADSDEQEANVNIHFPRTLLRKFIALYKELTCLWDRKSPAYKEKNSRHAAITRLTKLVQEHDPTATRVHVLRKIESLRACVRRESRRVRDSRRTAKSANDIYKPQLWYYDLFSFVFGDDVTDSRSHRTKTQGKAERRLAERPGSEGDDEQSAYDENIEFEQALDPTDYDFASSVVEVTESQEPSTLFCDLDDNSSKGKIHCTEMQDEYDAMGIIVAAKLRNLPENMRVLAEKLINDVLFQAQLNALNSSTVISTSDPFKQEPA